MRFKRDILTKIEIFVNYSILLFQLSTAAFTNPANELQESSKSASQNKNIYISRSTTPTFLTIYINFPEHLHQLSKIKQISFPESSETAFKNHQY
jgi:hypothetical protein